MKKTLNEEVTRIKSIMGCCKGKLNENEADCVNPESNMGQQILNGAATEVKSLGLTNDDIADSTQDTPEITDAKNKIGEILNPVMPKLSLSEIKAMIKELKVMKRKGKVTKTEQPNQLNEQLGAAAPVWAQITAFLATVPTGVFIAIAAWLLLRLLRCHVYGAMASISVSCGLDAQRSFLVKLSQLVLLDFRNLLETDNIFYGCG
jgi:hypothetical protein